MRKNTTYKRKKEKGSRRRKIIIGSIGLVFLLCMLPNISAIEYNTAIDHYRATLYERIQTIDVNGLHDALPSLDLDILDQLSQLLEYLLELLPLLIELVPLLTTLTTLLIELFEWIVTLIPSSAPN